MSEYLFDELPMKQFFLLIAMMLAGTIGSFYNAFWGLLLYYTLAVLRPQYLWDWALPPGWRWSLMAAGAVFLGVIVNLPRMTLKGRFNPISIMILVYSFFILMSLLNANDIELAQDWGIEFGKIVLIAIIAGVTVEKFWQINALALMVLITLGYAAWNINCLYFLDGRLDIFHSGYGGLDNNGAGLVMAMALPFAFCYAASATRKIIRLVCWCVCVLMIHAMLMSYSRGAMVATIVGICWLLLNYRPRRHVLLIILALALIVPALAGKEIQARFYSTGNGEEDPSIRSRYESWNAAWNMAWDHPITGVGIRNSNNYTENYGADVEGRTVHNQYLQTAADSGILAMTIYVIMIGAGIFMLGRAARICAKVRDECGHAEVPDSPAARAERCRYVILGFQTSLIIFAFGCNFLSLEVFELPWLLLVVAGVAPATISRELESHLTPMPAQLPVHSIPMQPRPALAN